MIYKFEPLLKQTLWGGDKIIPFKHLDREALAANPDRPSPTTQIGESWEISGVPGLETIVADGPQKGMKLNELVALLQGKLVGQENFERFGTEFPLLIKFIDARQNLSIQVHPNDETARRQGKQRGKTEMWYTLESDADAHLMVGLKKRITPEEYAQMVANDTICEAIAEYKAQEGDVFYLPAGCIHAIGAGSFVAEIQQTSDVTWRIYDYKRKDKNGNYRELHTQQAAESINFEVLPDYQTHYNLRKNEPTELVRCPHFTTAVYDLDEPMTLDYQELDSFVILIGLKGEGTIVTDDGQTARIGAGETLLLPATTKEVKVSGTVKFLETYC